MIHFLRLLGTDAKRFASLTHPAQAPLLEHLEVTSPVVAIGMVQSDQPIGLAVATARSGEPAELTSVFVSRQFWNRGHGTRLVTLLEEACRERGCLGISTSWVTHGRCAPAFERVLQKQGWTEPATTLHLATIDPAISQKADWIERLRVPEQYEVFPWNEITDADRDDLQAIRSSVPHGLWPLEEDAAPIEHTCSIGLRDAGQIIGWMICHRVARNLIRYTMMYVREPWRTPELSFAMLAEAVRRKQAHHPPTVHGTLAVQADNMPMLRVLERKLKPFALSWSEMRVSRKRLQD